MFRHLIIELGFIALFNWAIFQPAFAHNGIDHNNSCFLTVGETRLRISGYQFQPELEGKHFCHFYPGLGQTVVAVEPMQQEQGKTLVGLELARLTSWQRPDEAFTVVKRQAEQPLETGQASISETIWERGIYKLTVILNDDFGHSQRKSLMFLAGVPVTKILVMAAGGIFVLIVGFVAVNGLKKKN
jgi:hypothetical protein